ncbi:MAG: phosphatidylinositol mannoside acyltransferase, partial [Rhodococcus sp. (in: high G+C Gram-positive bacteria)]
IETGAALLPVHCWFTPGGWGFRIEPPIDTGGGVEAATQALASRFEENIAKHPEDWHMFQPLWLSDLSRERLSRMETS